MQNSFYRAINVILLIGATIFSSFSLEAETINYDGSDWTIIRSTSKYIEYELDDIYKSSIYRDFNSDISCFDSSLSRCNVLGMIRYLDFFRNMGYLNDKMYVDTPASDKFNFILWGGDDVTEEDFRKQNHVIDSLMNRLDCSFLEIPEDAHDSGCVLWVDYDLNGMIFKMTITNFSPRYKSQLYTKKRAYVTCIMNISLEYNESVHKWLPTNVTAEVIKPI